MSIYAIRSGAKDIIFRPLSGKEVVAAFGLMIALRLLISFIIVPWMMQRLGFNYVSEVWPDRYAEIAENLVNGIGYRIYPDTAPTMLRSPGFVLILASLFAFFGKSLLAVRVLHFVLSLLTALIIYSLSNRLFRVQQVALCAVALFLFHPVVMFAETRGGADVSLIFFFTLTIWLLFRAIELMSIRSFVLLGLAIGYTMLVKASAALVFPAAFLVLLLRKAASPRLLVRNFGVAAVIAALIMTPWTVRNYLLSGKFVPTMTVGGLALFEDMYAVKHRNDHPNSFQLFADASYAQIEIGHEMGLRMKEDFFPQFYSADQEVIFSRALAQRAWRQYKDDPGLLARAVLHNLWAFWFQGRTRTATLINFAIMLPFLGLCLYGGVRAVRRQPRCWILVATIIAFVLPHLVIIAVLRYSATLIPILSILAGASFLPRSSLSGVYDSWRGG